MILMARCRLPNDTLNRRSKRTRTNRWWVQWSAATNVAGYFGPVPLSLATKPPSGCGGNSLIRI